MATKYIDTTCTNNGDGTTSSCAASAGAAGAWNSFTELDGTPTYGTAPAAGDTVEVRTADGGGDITETMGASLTLPANTGALITVLFDDGTTWATGGGGTFIFQNTGGTEYDLTIGTGWHLRARDIAPTTRRFHRYHNSTGRANGFVVLRQGSIVEDTLMESNYAGTVGANIQFSILGTDVTSIPVFKNCTFNYTNSTTGWVRGASDGAKVHLINCVFDCTKTVIDATYNPIFQLSLSGNTTIDVWGGSVTNENSNVPLYNQITSDAETGIYRFRNFDSGVTKKGADVTWGVTHAGAIIMDGDGGSFNYLYHSLAGYVRAGWSGNGNHPTLNATLPDGSDTPWSLLCWNDNNYCSVQDTLTLFSTQKIYNAAAATKTVRVEMLIHNSITSPQKDEWYIDVWFVKDSDSSQGYVTSQTTGALASSTAGWSSTTYGGNSYTKYKIEVSTGVDIEQYTPFMVNLVSNRPSGATDQFYFVDPDFQLD